MAIVRFGWMLLVVAGFLGLVVLGLNVASLLIDDSTLQGAVISAALAVFSQPLSLRFIAMGVVGGLLVASAGALLPQVDITDHARNAVGLATSRPKATGWAVARALVIIAVGLLIVLFPTISSQVVAVVAGLVVLFYGVTELDVIAERSRAQDEAERAAARAGTEEVPQGRRSPVRWLIPVAAAAVGLLVLAALIIPGNLPQDDNLESASAVNTTACNGFDALCDVPFDQVVIPASHNSMSDRRRDLVPGRAAQGHGRVPRRRDPRAARGHVVRRAHRRRRGAHLGQVAGRRRRPSSPRPTARTWSARSGGPSTGCAAASRSAPLSPTSATRSARSAPTPMTPTMQRLNDWMDAHPREVVVLFIQDTVTPADTAAVLREGRPGGQGLRAP